RLSRRNPPTTTSLFPTRRSSDLATIDPGSAKMRVSGLGLVPAKYDAATKTISYQVTQPLRGETCTVIVEAKLGGKKLEAHWAFRDRKSTRLNSSHVSISYAVFCL